MGFLSGLWKGIKGAVKSIGRGIKKVVGKIGKFVGKLGIVGQIGMFFLMPHVAGFFMKGLGFAAKGLMGITGTGVGSSLVRGFGHVLNTAHKFAGTVGNVFGTITEGVTQFGKTALNKIPGINIEGAARNFFGEDSAWSRTFDKGSKILDPFKGETSFRKDTSFTDASRDVGIKESTLRELNPQFTGDTIPAGSSFRTDISPAGFNMAEASKAYDVAQPSFSITEDFITDPKGFEPSIYTDPEGLYTEPNKGYESVIPTAESFRIPEEPITKYGGKYPTLEKIVDTYDYALPTVDTFKMPSGQQTSLLAVQTEDALERMYPGAKNKEQRQAIMDGMFKTTDTTKERVTMGSSLKDRFSSDPLGATSTALSIAQQGKELVSDYDLPDPRGEILDFGNAPQIQRQQVAGVEQWMPFGVPAFAHGYAVYNPFSYEGYMQQRTSGAALS